MGYGDSIMVTGIAKNVKKKFPDYQIVKPKVKPITLTKENLKKIL